VPTARTGGGTDTRSAVAHTRVGPPTHARTLKHFSPQYWVWRHLLHFLVAPKVPQLLHGSPSLLPPSWLT
jgi:hypothetical protein